jgi:hypothetical protein
MAPVHKKPSAHQSRHHSSPALYHSSTKAKLKVGAGNGAVSLPAVFFGYPEAFGVPKGETPSISKTRVERLAFGAT